MAKMNLVGRRFGLLVVLHEGDGKVGTTGFRRRTWHCRCDCGGSSEIVTQLLNNGETRSCGCLYRAYDKTRSQMSQALKEKHGLELHSVQKKRSAKKPYSKSEHAQRGERNLIRLVWVNMLGRCFDPRYKHYASYGGRGITVCDRWRESFRNFANDMGPRPPKHSIERIDNNAGYSPENCRWSNQLHQNQNKRNNRKVIVNGTEVVLAEYCRITGIPYSTANYRHRNGLL